MAPDTITYDLTSKRRYATTTTLVGLFVGGAVALASGGSAGQQMAVTALIAAIVSGSSCWVLCKLAAAVTGGTGYYRIAYPAPESATRVESESERDQQEAGDESTLEDFR